jgi:Ulp1 family protease
LEFAELDDLSKCLLESFFDGISSVADEDDLTGIFEAAPTPMDLDSEKKLLKKKKGSDCENGENIPPVKKKSRLDENNQRPTRSLRSRNQNPQIATYNPQDYASDEEEIPEALRVPSETTLSKTPSRFDRFEHFENTIPLLTYHDIHIEMEDYKCLDRRELVSNFVLDFYLQYLWHEVFPEELRRRVHIYKTHFYTLLATKANFAGWNDDGIKGQKAADKRYDRVKDLDSDVNIFDRDFLVFPCNTNEHWFLAIACFPRLNGAVYADTGEPIADEDERVRDSKNPSEGRALKSSCVLIFDSVSTNPGRKTAAMNHIRNFLMSEYRAKYASDFPLEYANIRTNAPKVRRENP